MLTPGSQVREFTVTTIDGRKVAYADLWQRKNVLLVLLSCAESNASRRYHSGLAARAEELTAHDTAMIVTTDSVSGVVAPAVVIADRWGEVFFATEAEDESRLPGPGELIEWLRFVQQQCPECQGEAR